jgi:membrane protein
MVEERRNGRPRHFTADQWRCWRQVYGSLAAVVIFLVWMWTSNTAVLIGAELNAELERGRAIASGLPPGTEPFTELRDTRKLRKNARRKPAA